MERSRSFYEQAIGWRFVDYRSSRQGLDLTDGVNNLPVAFTALHNTIADPTGGTTFTPSVGVAATNLDATTGQLHVYVGGTVTAAANQVAGSYSAQVELTAAYTGN